MSELLHVDALKAFVDDHKDDMVATWKKFVDTPSQDGNRDDLRHMADVLKEAFEGVGFDVELIETGGEADTPTVYGIWGADRPGAPILFSGHYDTVRLEGGKPFYYDEEGRVRGLGSLDMKGGIAISLWVVKALQSISWDKRPIKILFVGDEETGHIGATVPEVIAEKSTGALCAFNMETGLPTNEICIGRKGNAQADFVIHGVSAHSGNEWIKGRNAILEASYLIQELDALTQYDLGTTVSATIISGGTVPNSIPGECKVITNIRSQSKEEHDRVVAALEEIAKHPHVEDCTREYEFWDLMGPFETKPEGVRFASFISSVSEQIGQGEMGQKYLGGGSDASFICMAGVPTVCSMGVRGEFNHTMKEYAIQDTLFERAVLIANVVDVIDEFEAGKPQA